MHITNSEKPVKLSTQKKEKDSKRLQARLLQIEIQKEQKKLKRPIQGMCSKLIKLGTDSRSKKFNKQINNPCST